MAAEKSHFEIFRHGPIIIYTRLPAGGTYYPICTFPASSEYLISISDTFSAFCLRVSVIYPTYSLYPNKSVPTLRYTHRHGPICTGPCRKALNECSPLDFRRSSIDEKSQGNQLIAASTITSAAATTITSAATTIISTATITSDTIINTTSPALLPPASLVLLPPPSLVLLPPPSLVLLP